MIAHRKSISSLIASIIAGEIWLWALTRDVWYLDDPWLWFNVLFVSVVVAGWSVGSVMKLLIEWFERG